MRGLEYIVPLAVIALFALFLMVMWLFSKSFVDFIEGPRKWAPVVFVFMPPLLLVYGYGKLAFFIEDRVAIWRASAKQEKIRTPRESRIPSKPFKAFEQEAKDWVIGRFHVGDAAIPEIKAQKIARAEGIAVREAYMVPWWCLFAPGLLDHFHKGIKDAEDRLAAAGQDPDVEQRHAVEVCQNLYGRTIHHFTLRRLYTVAALASVAAAIASVAAVVLTIFSLVCGPRG